MADYIYAGVTSTGISLYNDMYIQPGGTAKYTTVCSGGDMYIRSGGTANVTTVDSGGEMYINGTANSTTVNSDGDMYISSGGTANVTTVNSGGAMRISSGGTANSTTVSAGGVISIASGGTATDIVWTPCVGYVLAEDGANVTYASDYSGVYFGSNNQLLSKAATMDGKVVSGVSGSMYVMNNGVANSTTVCSGGDMYISSGGTANSTTVNDYGCMVISSGGTANSTTVSDGGDMYIESGGTANSTTVNDRGSMYISSGGTANSTTVSSGGSMYISSGGTATDIVWTPCVGYISAADGAYVTYASDYSGVYFGSNNQLLSNAETMSEKEVLSGRSMYVMNNGVANSTTVRSYGSMYIYSGGTANSTTVNGGSMFISSGGTANSTTVSGGGMTIYSGGTANSTTVNYYGSMFISSGGTANSTTVYSSGRMSINSGGTANSTTVNSSGYMYIRSGGTANSTTVSSRSFMYIYSGGVHRGSLQVAAGGTVSAYEGAQIDFTLSDRNSEDGYLINGLSWIYGTPTFTITVATNQQPGTYKLAQGAIYFSGSISIGDGTTEYGTLSVNGDDLAYGGTTFSLDRVDGNLLLTLTYSPSVFIYSSGSLTSSGAFIENAELISGGNDSMHILFGGSTANTTVNAGGSVLISSGGMADIVHVSSGGGISVDGNVTNLHLSAGAYLGGFAFQEDKFFETVENGSAAILGDSFISGSTMHIKANNALNNISQSGGSMLLEGTVYGTTMLKGGMYVHSGGRASQTEITSAAQMTVYNGGWVYGTAVNDSGVIYIEGDNHSISSKVENPEEFVAPVVIDTTMYGGFMNVRHGSATGIAVGSSAKVRIYESGVAEHVSGGGQVEVYSKGLLRESELLSGGRIHVSSGGTASDTTVSDGGVLYLSSGGIHKGFLQLENGAVVSAYEGAQIDFNLTERNTEADFLINDISLIEGTPTYTITVAADQEFGTYKLAQGAANFTGTITVGDGTTEYGSVTVNGDTFEYNDVKYTLTGTDGNLLLDIVDISPKVFIYSSGTLTSSGMEIADAILKDGGNNSMHISSGGTANSTTVNKYGSMYISSGGTANSTTVNKYGSMFIHSGGTANSTTVNSWGGMYIYSGGTANFTTVSSGGDMYISSGGTANSTTVDSRGYMYIYSGGTANNTGINTNGQMHIVSGGTANSTTINYGGQMSINGTANSTTAIYEADIMIGSGGTANNTTLNNGCGIYISRGGTANSTTINFGGSITISSAGTASNTIVNSGGKVYIYANCVHYGLLTIEKGAAVSAYAGKIDFTLTDRSADDGYLINDISLIKGTPTYSITVAPNQQVGTYKLAQGAENFTGTITVGDGTTEYGTLSVNGAELVYNNASYSLNLSGGELTLTITDPLPTLTITGNATAWTNEDVFLIATPNEENCIIQYKIDDGEWQNYENGVLITHNALVIFKVTDQGDNTVTESVEVTFIDKNKPDAPVLSSDMGTRWANVPVCITAECDGSIVQYSFDGKSWETYSESLLVTSNGEVLFRCVDEAGNISETVSYTVDKIDPVADFQGTEYIFINAKYTDKVTGKAQNGVTLAYGKNAFISRQVIPDYVDLSSKMLVTLDSKVDGDQYANLGVVAGAAVTPVMKETANSYSYTAKSKARGTLEITKDTGSTEFIRFATVNLTGAKTGNLSGGNSSSSENTKSAMDKKGAVTETEKFTFSSALAGKFNGKAGSVESVTGYATVDLSGTSVAELSGGTEKTSTSSKVVDGTTKDQKNLSTSDSSAASGKVTLKEGASAEVIENYQNVTLTGTSADKITNFTSKDTQKESAAYDEAKGKVNRTVTLTHTESTSGTLKATGSTLGDVTGFATVTLKDVADAGNFSRVDENGAAYSSIKETVSVKTNKDNSVTESYKKTETFIRSGKFTAANSNVGDIQNFSTVTLDGTSAKAVSNFVESKIVTEGSRNYANMEAYGTPEDYVSEWKESELTSKVTTSLNGSVTLKNGASAVSITNFKSVAMSDSSVGTISNVGKVTVNKGESSITSYTGNSGNDTFTIAKGAVLTANAIDLGEETKDTVSINGTLILTGTTFNAAKVTGKGEIAANEEVYAGLDIEYANVLDLGKTSENFRGTAYETADDNYKKAVKWDGEESFTGWLGSWEGGKSGSDTVDHIRFKAEEGFNLEVSGGVSWTLLDKNGNDIGQAISAAGEYILELRAKDDFSVAYTVQLA